MSYQMFLWGSAKRWSGFLYHEKSLTKAIVETCNLKELIVNNCLKLKSLMVMKWPADFFGKYRVLLSARSSLPRKFAQKFQATRTLYVS